MAERKAKAGRSGVLGPPVGRRGQDAGGLSGRRPWAGKGGFTGSRLKPGVAVKLEHSGKKLFMAARQDLLTVLRTEEKVEESEVLQEN